MQISNYKKMMNKKSKQINNYNYYKKFKADEQLQLKQKVDLLHKQLK